MATIRHLFVSPGHNYFGHHGGPAGDSPTEEREQIRCLAGRGIEGDRFLDYKPNYKGQLTLLDWAVVQGMRERFSAPWLPAEAFRRNVVIEGLDLNALVGKRFELQGLALEGVEECRPCYWMDQAVGAGAEEWMRGRGGLRCRILADGILRSDAEAAK